MDVEMSCMVTEEKDDQRNIFHNPVNGYGDSPTIDQLFEIQVTKNENSLAICSASEGKSLSYLELSHASNTLAHYLTNNIANEERHREFPIAICAPRSAALITSIIGILKMGRAYMPLDENCTVEQWLYMLENSKASAIIVSSKQKSKLNAFDGQIIPLESLESIIATENNKSNPKIRNIPTSHSSNDLAYVMYTSGSTGKPKGVKIEHASVINRLRIPALSAHCNDNVLFLSALTFDNSVFEIFSPLLSGGTLTMGPENLRDMTQLAEFIQEQNITVLQMVPCLLNELIRVRCAKKHLQQLRMLITGGEVLSWTLCQKTLEILAPQTEFYNIYGVTEATVDSTAWKCTVDSPYDFVPIGKPISENISVYILNDNMELCLDGKEGELFIGGAGLARGYICPEITHEKFINGPFESPEIKVNRLYKTGDRARFLPDGNIEYLGRNDDQVKVNGIRVELGEIEVAILLQDFVQQTVVVCKNVAGKNILVAYVTLTAENVEITSWEQTLYERLGQTLIPQIIPSFYVSINEFPLTSSGKIDRKQLTNREIDLSTLSTPCEEPTSETERILRDVWVDILKVKIIGINDNFFRLGGDSITAMQICFFAQDQYGISFTVNDIFNGPTISKLAQKCSPCKKRNMKMDEQTYLNPIVNASLPYPMSMVTDIYQLTPLQNGLLFNSLKNSNCEEYLVRSLIKINGSFRIDVFQKAWEKIISKHSALRTGFTWEVQNYPLQFVLTSETPLINSTNWKLATPLQNDNNLKDFLESLKDSEKWNPIALTQVPLMNWQIYPVEEGLEDKAFYFIWTVHHVILDGWSVSLVLSEVFSIYDQISRGENVLCTQPDSKFKPYVMETLFNENSTELSEFWDEYFKGSEIQEPFPILLPRQNEIPKEKSEDCLDLIYDVVLHDVDDKLMEGISKFCKECEITLNTALQAAWAILLHRYLQADDVVFGMTMSCRSSSSCQDVDKMVGLLINTVPFRSQISESDSIKEFMHKIQSQTNLLATVCQVTQLNKIPAINIRRNHTSAFCDTLFVFENYPDTLSTTKQFHEITATEIKIWDTNEFPLTLAVLPLEASAQLAISYKSTMFDCSSIEKLALHYTTILRSIVSLEENNKVGSIELMTTMEKEEILVDWNKTESEFSLKDCIHDLFRHQVKINPNGIAVYYNKDKQLTYEELDEKSDKLAHFLKTKQKHSETLFAVCCDKTLEFFISILGILKSGGAFIPLDPMNPTERLCTMICNSGAHFLILDNKYETRFSTENQTAAILILNDIMEQMEVISIENNPLSIITPNSLAYMMYTSGTTGVPKAVQIEHRGISNMSIEMGKILKINSNSKILQFASIGFDAFVSEWAIAFGNGATLYLPPSGKKYELVGENLANILLDRQITFVTLPPSVLRTVTTNDISFPHLKTIISAGEAGDNKLFEKWTAAGVDIFNAYGPTEGTVCATITKFTDTLQSNNIGRPLPNTKVYILDKNKRLVPPGVYGFIHIAGIGVARGYHNSPTEYFVPNHFISESNLKDDTRSLYGTLYSTGDIGRFLQNGTIELRGRSDDQVKLRGYRIELKEIENAILMHFDQMVSDVAVITREVGEQKKIVAHLCISKKLEAKITDEQIIQNLKEILPKHLPDYMVPSFFVILEQIPKTINGKVDKNSLATVKIHTGFHINHSTPTNETEKTLCKIWSELLGVSPIGIHDNFFQIGGDSIQCILMCSRAKIFGIIITVKQIFENPTISRLASISASHNSQNENEPKQFTLSENPLMPIQRWFFEQKFQHANHWNQSVYLSPKCYIDPDILEKAMYMLVKDHPVLRARFFARENEVTQEVIPICKIRDIFERVDLASNDRAEEQININNYANQVHSSFNLQTGSLFRAILFQLDDSQRIFMCAHHTVIDNVSWMILIEELSVLCETLMANDKIPQTNSRNTDNYYSWASALSNYSISDSFIQKDLEYWEKEMELKSNVHEIFLMSDTDERSSNIEIHTQVFSVDLTSQLLHQANMPYKTKTNELLVTSWAYAVREIFDQENICIMMEGHGRCETLNPTEQIDLSKSVGWFTSLFPLVLQLSNNFDVDTSIKYVKEKLRNIPNDGVSFGILRYLKESDDNKSFATGEMPRMSFNYAGVLDTSQSSNIFDAISSQLHSIDISPENHLPFSLAIDAEINQKQLHVVYNYDSKIFSKSTMEKLWTNFASKLESIVEHCLSQVKMHYTPSDFPLIIPRLNQQSLDKITSEYPNLSDLYPLTPAQSGILLSCLMNSNKPFSDSSYITQLVYDIRGEFSLENFQKAWKIVVEQYDVLRSAFIFDGFEQQLQYVVDPENIELFWNFKKLHGNTNAKVELQKILLDDYNQPIHLGKLPLFRFQLIQVDQMTCYFIWTFHHIILDGWSGAIVLKSVLHAYHQLQKCNNRLIPYRESKSPFINYVRHIYTKNEDEREKTKRFWIEYLQDFQKTKFLSIMKLDDKNPDASVTHHEVQFQFSTEETEKIKNFAKQHTVTLNTAMQTAWALLLSFYSSREDIVFGVVQSGRHSYFEDIVGLLISTVPFRIKIDHTKETKDLLIRIQSIAIELQELCPTHLSKIQSCAKYSESDDLSLFDTLFVFENYPDDSDVQCLGENAQMELVKIKETTEYRLVISVHPESNNLTVTLIGSAKEFDEVSLKKLAGHYKTVANSLTNAVDIQNISWLTKEEHLRLQKWNCTADTITGPPTIHQLFENQVKMNPNVDAVTMGDFTVTYNELNGQANQWAALLINMGVVPGVMVAICLERSVALISALLGILKSGGVYVPLDPSYPAQRLDYMIKDSAPHILITNQNYGGKIFQSYSGQKVILEDISSLLKSFPTENIKVPLFGNSLAYIMYTSGSTGRPKGVAMNHACIVNLFHSTQISSPIGIGDTMLVKISLSFDVSVSEIFWPLCTGAKLALLPPFLEKDVSELAKCIQENDVTVLRMVPSVLNAMLQLDDIPATCSSLKIIIVSGEQLAQETFHKVMALLPNVNLCSNKYGPTETHEITTWEGSRQKFIDNEQVTIGKPIHNCKIFILNEYRKQVPVGVVGEIYIGGICLANEYLNAPEVTKKKFIENPFYNKVPLDAGESKRLYSTGDLGRFLEDGNIEYLGRVDDQIKIRGFRIEPKEIESVLKCHHLVQDAFVTCVVIDNENSNNSNKVLTAYVVPIEIETEKNRKLKTIHTVQKHLKEHLPGHMIPTSIILMKKFPLTTNGKIDRKSLPQIGQEPLAEQNAEPMSPSELKLATIWKSALGLNTVSRYDNFFFLGGHSLLAMNVKYKMKKEFGVDISLAKIFEQPILHELAKILAEEIIESPFIPPSNVLKSNQSKFPLSLQQDQLWLTSKLMGESSPAYSIPIYIQINGALDVYALKRALVEMGTRHKSLRTVFPEIDGIPYAKILDSNSETFEFLHWCVSDVNCDRVAEECVTLALSVPFNLNCGPLLRCRVLEISATRFNVLFNLHHIICDNESVNVFLKDLFSLYRYITNGKLKCFRVELPNQYIDWAVQQRYDIEKKLIESQLRYWKEELSGLQDLQIQLPYDFPRPSVLSYKGHSISFELSNGLTAQLLNLAHSEGTTIFQLLLAAFHALLYRYSNYSEHILVGYPISCRTPEFQNSIGFFVNTVVSKSSFPQNHSLTFKEFLKHIREDAQSALSNHNVPFHVICETIGCERKANANPLFQVMFSFIQQQQQLSKLDDDLDIDVIDIASQSSKFDLTLAGSLMDGENPLCKFSIEYATDLFEEETIVRIKSNFIHLLESITKSTEQLISKIPLLSPKETESILNLNRGKVPNNKYKNIVTMFQSQVERTPKKLAVTLPCDTKMSYSELNCKSNQIANYLTGQVGIKHQSAVVVCLPSSENLLLYFWGILKAGCIYVPIDVTLPEKRISSILKNCQPAAIITNINEIPLGDIPVQSRLINPENILDVLSEQSTENLEMEILEDDIMYIIYTSGSTGNPKGVLTRHLSIVNWVETVEKEINFNDDSFLFCSSPGFDVSVSEILLPLLIGGHLVVAPPGLGKDVYQLSKVIKNNRISVLRCVPTLLHELTDSDLSLSCINSSLRIIISAGESLSYFLGNRIITNVPNATLYNMYGATEAAIDCTLWKVELSYGKIIIGKPFHNVDMYILDKYLQPCPPGVIGEICISGACLAKGYLNLTEETTEKFLINPYKNDRQNHSIIYKTGDLGRLLPDGNIECLGRIDFQIKLRGFRLELEEVQLTILQLNFVKQAVVLLLSDDKSNDSYLVAYVQLKYSEPNFNMKIKEHLQLILPYYMIPSHFVAMDQFPLTTSGKIDRNRFPKPLELECTRKITYTAPQTDMEITLESIWRETLGIKREIGRHDNFFSLGGHSVLAVRAARSIELKVNTHLPVSQVYLYPTIASLARIVESMASQIPSLVLPSHVFPIHEGGNKPPLFLVHHSLALAADFFNLPILDNDQPIYGINNPRYGLEENEAFSSVELMAQLYIQVILKLCPKGPYRLGGWCFGGTIALEMAWILEKMGRKVEIVLMIDTFNIPISFIKEVTKNDTEGTEKKALRMLISYEPKQYQGKTVLFKARDIRLSNEEKESEDNEDISIMKSVFNGWENLLPQIEVFSVDGDNDTLLDFPFVLQLSKVLFQALESIENGDVYQTMSTKERTLFRAVIHNDHYIVQQLLAKNSEINFEVRNDEGETIFMLAEKLNDPIICNILKSGHSKH